MKKEIIKINEMKLIGLTAHTNNRDEMNPEKAKIGATIQKYFGESSKITDHKNAGTTYCVYTEYESDYTGDYTYFIGAEVNSLDNVPNGFSTLVIPSQSYAKFTTDSGVMPQICIDAWQKIWQMDSKELSGDRAYIADFEVYDSRAADWQNTVLDIYIGIK